MGEFLTVLRLTTYAVISLILIWLTLFGIATLLWIVIWDVASHA